MGVSPEVGMAPNILCVYTVPVGSGVGTVERLGGATLVENLDRKPFFNKTKHVTVKLIHETTHY